MSERLMAPDAVAKYGRSLIGREIITARYGAWPGGRAKVTEINPDENAPDIVMTVKAVESNTMVTAAILSKRLDSDEIGVLENEEVIVLDPPIEWFCEGCQRALHPASLTRVGIGVHHYNDNKDDRRDGLLNCGPVRQRPITHHAASGD